MLFLYKFSELSAKKNPALADAFGQFGFRGRQLVDDTFGRRIESLSEQYTEIVLLHEIAEFREAVPEWKQVLAAAGDRVNELYLRALKDIIADTSDHGPLRRIVETRDRGALGFSVSLPEGFHRMLLSDLRDAWAGFRQDGDWNRIEQARRTGYERFVAERERIVDLYRKGGSNGFAVRLKSVLPS